MPSHPILYSFRRCPYAMRARMGVLASGIAVELREVVLRDKPAEMLAASPKGTVPVLVLPDGGVIDESLDIMRWALEQSDPRGWLSRDDAAAIARNDGSFKHHLDRYKYPGRHGSVPAEHRAAGLEILVDMDARLAAGGKVGDRQLCGDAPGIADIATFPFVRQFAATDQTWFDAQPLPHLQRWLADHVGSDLFARVMLRLSPWKPGDEAVVFGAY